MTTFRLDVFAPATAAAAAASVVLCNIPVPAAAQQSAIPGIVADSGTGRPLENVEVTLDAGDACSIIDVRSVALLGEI